MVIINHPMEELLLPTAWCGWETPNAKWGAIWQYKRTEDYVTFPDKTLDFEVPDTYSNLNVAARYRFTISSGSATLDEITTGTVTKTTSGGSTKFSIPNVNHNPILIRFQ